MSQNEMMTRREFVAAAAACGVTAAFADADGDGYRPEIVRDTVDLGLGKPFRMLHASDTHICGFYASEAAGLSEKMRVRREIYWKYWEKSLPAQLAYAKDNGLPILHTGDLIDFASFANIAEAKRFFAAADVFACVGNHEFGCSGNDLRVTKMLLDAFWPNEISIASRVVNGVNFVAFDNSRYALTSWTTERLRAEFRKNLPTVLLCHIPFYEPSLHGVSIGDHWKKAGTSYLLGVPRAICKTYPDWARKEQTPTEETMDNLETLRKEPNLRAILTGHLHFPFSSRFSPTAMQYVCGCGGYRHGQLREITFC